VTGQDDRRIIGVTSLATDPDHDAADFGILVADDWQGRGLGTLLTEYTLQVARAWRLNRITAHTSATNPRMIRIFTKLGFELERQPADNLVLVDKWLGAEDAVIRAGDSTGRSLMGRTAPTDARHSRAATRPSSRGG
jgi:acetyltransferase